MISRMDSLCGSITRTMNRKLTCFARKNKRDSEQCLLQCLMVQFLRSRLNSTRIKSYFVTVAARHSTAGAVASDGCGVSVRGTFSAKGSDSSVGGVPVGYCPDDVHMEEEVQVKVQVEEEEIGEKHGREQDEEQGERINDQVAHMQMT